MNNNLKQLKTPSPHLKAILDSYNQQEVGELRNNQWCKQLQILQSRKKYETVTLLKILECKLTQQSDLHTFKYQQQILSEHRKLEDWLNNHSSIL